MMMLQLVDDELDPSLELEPLDFLQAETEF